MQEESVQPQKAENQPSPSLEEQLAEARAKLAEQRDQMLRTAAEADNARKRAQTEAANAQKYALERFANGLLPVLDSLERAIGSRLSDNEKDEFRRVQLQANRWTYLGTGMTHEKVLETLESLTPKARQRVESIAPAFC